jgi:hypothetical protein
MQPVKFSNELLRAKAETIERSGATAADTRNLVTDTRNFVTGSPLHIL